MQYRKLNTGESVSEIGLGTGSLRQASDDEIKQIFEFAFENGVNFMDTGAVEETWAVPVKEFLKDKREEMHIQMHIGAVFPDGQYTQSRDLDLIKKSFDGELNKFGCDYANWGVIHYVDAESDYNKIYDNGIYDYAVELRDEGKINHVALSTHTPSILERFMDDVDLVMFSINPSFDFDFKNNKLIPSAERFDLYRKCEQNGVDLTVMKTFGGGKLLNEQLSPLNVELTPFQCMKYALDRPAVKTVLPGITSLNQLKELLTYYEKSSDELDYGFIGDLAANDMKGNCIYCNHCQPCPEGIDIALVNKLYDLAKIGDEMAHEHYKNLKTNAGDCMACGNCEDICAFDVPVIYRMMEINQFF